MFKNKEKIKFDFFIVFSLLVFVVFGSLYVLMGDREEFKFEKNDNYTGEKLYLNNEYLELQDPYITKNPGLSEILAGPIISNIDPMQGDKKAPIAIVVFSDFTCDYCSRQEQVLKKIVEEYKYKVRLIWKDYPRVDKDSASYLAAKAARCAQVQDNFWPFHDFLFEFNDNLSQEKFLEIADLVSLNKNKFKTCLESEEVETYIDDNILEANALGITGVPYIYINDEEVMGEIDLTEMRQLVELELK